jgi:hypothetical protein
LPAAGPETLTGLRSEMAAAEARERRVVKAIVNCILVMVVFWGWELERDEELIKRVTGQLKVMLMGFDE